MKTIRAVGFFGVLGVAIASGDRLRASGADTDRVLGMESVADWTAENGSALSLSSTRTQGMSSLAVQAHGYTVVRSRLLGPLGTATPQLLFDLLLPTQQPNPYWLGAVQVFVSAPSAGLNNAYVGQRELTGLPLGSFTRLGFDVPSAVRNVLSSSTYDVSFSVVLNVPNDATGTYLMDNLQVSAGTPAEGTIGLAEIPRILGFENAPDWQVTSGTNRGTTIANVTEGNVSLAVSAVGYTTITSLPMPSIAPVNPTVTFDLWLPTQQPDPYWFGAAQLFASAPSLGLYNAYLGQHELTGLATGRFHTLAFNLPADVQTKLNSTSYSDLRFTIVLNVPSSGTGIYYLDRLDVGPVTRPLEPPIGPFRHDLVGTATSGVATLSADDEDFSPPVRQFLIYVNSVDGNCVPSATRACRFVVPYLLARTGGFELGDDDISEMVIQSGTPFQVVLGGSQGLTAKVPSYVQFMGSVNASFGNVIIFPRNSNLTIGINPAGDGLITLSGSFSSRIDDVDITIGLSLTANTPLTNRMPVPNAGPDVSVTSSTCEAVATLDGSGSTDPDGNLQELRWLRDGVTVGVGPQPQIRIAQSGATLLRLVATDTFTGEAADEVIVNAQLGQGCP